MTSIDVVAFPCFQVRQPIGVFYVGVIDSQELLELTYSDIRRMRDEPREVETYLGIERPLSTKRVNEIRQYVQTVSAAFPSSIIVAVESEQAEFDEETGTLQLIREPGTAKILDGQHRLAGLDGMAPGTFYVIVTVFVDMDLEDQALTFATINLEQTKVSKSLVYDLYEYAKHRSPQKTAHDIVRLLDLREASPFAGRIKILGTANDRGEVLSQAQFVEGLMPMIAADPRRDRDLIKRGRRPERASAEESRFRIFRNMFLDEKDAEIARVLFNYFSAVAARWPTAWATIERGNVLNRTTGFRGLMLFLPSAYEAAKPADKSIPSIADFSAIFAKVTTLSDEDFTPLKFPTGSSGWSTLRDALLYAASLPRIAARLL